MIFAGLDEEVDALRGQMTSYADLVGVLNLAVDENLKDDYRSCFQISLQSYVTGQVVSVLASIKMEKRSPVNDILTILDRRDLSEDAVLHRVLLEQVKRWVWR